MAEIDDTTSEGSARPPVWFFIAAVLACLFEGVGLTGYLLDALRSPEQISQLPLDQRLIWNATPTWVYIVYAVATISGMIGAIALLARRRWSIPVLGLSLLAVVIQFGGIYALPRLRRLLSPDAMIAPLVIFIICALVYALAHHADRRGWLR